MDLPVTVALRSETGETHYDGTLTRADGSFLLRYCEGDELHHAACELSLSPARVTLTRRGAVCMTLTFAPGLVYDGVYRTPYGSFPLRCETQLLSAAVNDSGGRVALRYRLTFGGQTDVHRLLLRIKPRVEV